MGKQGFLQKECKINLKLVLEVIYIHNKMELAGKLERAWFRAGQLKDKEAIRPALDKCIKDLKDNGPAYLVELSKCDCCKRHQTDRPCNINELKKYEWNDGSGIEKHRNMIMKNIFKYIHSIDIFIVGYLKVWCLYLFFTNYISRFQKICEVKINDENFYEKHIKTIKQNYLIEWLNSCITLLI